MDFTTADAKHAAASLRRSLASRGVTLGHSHALEIVAKQLGFNSWNNAAALLKASPDDSGIAIPVLRTQDEQLAREFYLDYLGFEVEWEHRYEAGWPLYVRIRRGRTVLDLSEHHGDGTPGSTVWIPVRSIRSFHNKLTSRPHPRLRPGIDNTTPGGPTVTVIDPWGNTLRFCEVSD